MKNIMKIIRREPGWGQSLVETALFLPILIVMLAGLVEVGNLLINQNRVTTASRISTGFGAANYDRANFADVTAIDMGVVALNTVTETMDLAPEKWDIWAIRARVRDEAGIENEPDPSVFFEQFEAVHAYGSHQVVTVDEWNNELEAQVRQDMMNDLKSWPGGVRGLEVVSAAPFNDVETILGLPIWQWTGVRSIRAMTVMRIKDELVANSCPILPIAVRLNQYSVYPQNWTGTEENPIVDPDTGFFYVLGEQSPGDIPIELPGGDVNWEYPDPPPEYLNGSVAPILQNAGADLDIFELNRPGISLETAIADGNNQYSGNVYFAREEATSGNFGWLQWRGGGGANALADSLEPPGNFYTGDGYAGSEVDLNDSQFSNDLPPGYFTGDGYESPDASLIPFGPGVLEPGEFVWVETGNVNSSRVRDNLAYYIDNEIPVTLLVFDRENDEICDAEGGCGPQGGRNTLYQAYAFITVRIIGYKFEGHSHGEYSPKWMVFQFLNARNECGEVG